MPSTVSKRMGECPVRRQLSCGLIDVALGWQQPLSMVLCDECWALGGPAGPKGQDKRMDLQLRVLDNCRTHLDRTSTPVALTIMRRHMGPEERDRAFLQQAPRFGEERALAEARTFSEELAERTRAVFDGMTPEEKTLALPPRQRWGAVRSAWEEAAKLTEEVERWSLPRRGFYFVRAMWDKLRGRRVNADVREVRNISCTGKTMAGVKIAEPCPSLKTGKDGRLYCGDCGCGERRLAQLDEKLWIDTLPCPRRRRGFFNARPA